MAAEVGAGFLVQEEDGDVGAAELVGGYEAREAGADYDYGFGGLGHGCGAAGWVEMGCGRDTGVRGGVSIQGGYFGAYIVNNPIWGWRRRRRSEMW